MEPRRVRLRVEGLETRETPATMAAVSAAAAQTQANAAIIRTLAADPRWMANPAFRPALQAFIQGLFQQSNSAVTVMRDARLTLTPLPGQVGPTEAQARANMATATSLGNMLGIPVTPPVPPARPNADAGMTNVMPPQNSTSWVNQANGLKTWDVVTPTTGTTVAAGDLVSVFYTGWVASTGIRFAGHRSPSVPLLLNLDNVIPGWQQGLVGMRYGGIRRLQVPAALAAGTIGTTTMPANADLIFEVKVVRLDFRSPQWVTRPNGLKTWDLVVGSGDPAVATDNVTVFYKGWLASNGHEFDSTLRPETPASFNLAGGVIAGWTQGIPGMRPGGVRRLHIPAALAYGNNPPSGSSIPPNATLVFEVEMVSHT